MTPVAMQFVHEFSCLIYQIGAQCMNSISRDAQQASYCSHFEVYLVYSIYIYTYTHTYIYMYVCMHTYIFTYVNVNACICIHVHVYVYVSVSVSVSVCVRVRVDIYIYERAAFRVYLALAFPCNTGSYFKYFK